jgi:hypothetical protein
MLSNINKRIWIVFNLLFFFILIYSTGSYGGNMEKLILNKDMSIVLPQFDTSGISENHIENITLHLYLSDFSSQTRKRKIHLTINLFNEEKKDFEDGISVFIEPKINTYIGFSLPKELFQKMLVSQSRLLISMIDKNAQMIFEGPESTGVGKDPYLDVTASSGEEVSPKNYIVNYNFYNVNNSQIHYGKGNNISNNKYPAKKNGKRILYFVIFVIVIVLVFHKQLDWSQILDPKYWIDKKLDLPFKKDDSKSEQNVSRPLVYIEPDKIEYSDWSEKEKLDNPLISSRCEKIILYFRIRNSGKLMANNVNVKAASFILQEKSVGEFSPADFNNLSEHNLHLVSGGNSGRQPFVLALDKKAVKYFNDGTVKVKLIVNVEYNGLNDSKNYWNESAFIYSPIFENHAEEIYSKGN